MKKKCLLLPETNQFNDNLKKKFKYTFGCVRSSLQPVGSASPWHVGSWFTSQGANLQAPHCKPDVYVLDLQGSPQ